MNAVPVPSACALSRLRGARRSARHVAVILLAGLSAATAAGDHGDAPTPVAGPAPESGAIANLRTEVRLRKLHLVRPDLIQYPLVYEVNC